MRIEIIIGPTRGQVARAGMKLTNVIVSVPGLSVVFLVQALPTTDSRLSEWTLPDSSVSDS